MSGGEGQSDRKKLNRQGEMTEPCGRPSGPERAAMQHPGISSGTGGRGDSSQANG